MAKQKILVVGSGGREHALAWRAHEEGCEVVVTPGREGMRGHATIAGVGVGDHEGIVELAASENVDLVIVGPEQPLCEGLADRLREAGVPVVGPSAAAARLEGSKADAKAFMQRHGIPTARSHTVTDLDSGLAAIAQFETPPVVKASGLAAGKGVIVSQTRAEAEEALRDCLLGGRFGEAGAEVVIEERLEGREVSFFVLTDGTRWATFEPSTDHKRIGEGDTGPNTGGMGAYAPADVCSEAVRDSVLSRVVEPTLGGLRDEGRPFVGVLFCGLMVEADGTPKVIEYNVRFGDPEAQPLLFGLQDPVMPHFFAAARGEMESGVRLRGRPSATVVLASAGYPATSTKGVPIFGIEAADALSDVQVFHAGTRREAKQWLTDGGRVLGVCARGDDLHQAVERAYRGVDLVRFDGVQVRRDIAARAL